MSLCSQSFPYPSPSQPLVSHLSLQFCLFPKCPMFFCPQFVLSFAQQYSAFGLPHGLFLISSLKGHLGYFQFQAVRKKLTNNIYIQVFGINVSFPLGQISKHMRVRLLVQINVYKCMFNFIKKKKKPAKLFSKAAVRFCLLPSSMEVLVILHSHQHLVL